MIVAALLSLVGTSCGSDDSDLKKSHGDDDDFEGVSVAGLPLLAAGCTLTATAMTVIVKDGESALISFRPSDSMVTVNGHVFNGTTDTGNDCLIAPTGTSITIQSDTTGATSLKGRSVILDYINGLYLLGSGTLPAIKINFTLTGDNGSKNSLKVRGSDYIDLFSIGAGTGTGATAIFALNVNAKTGVATSQAGGTGNVSVTLDTIPDVTLQNVGNVMMSTGSGDDRLDASGTAGTGTAFPNVIKLYGGDGSDTILGGLAGDTISGGANADTLSGCAGNDTYDMGSVAGGADVIAQACVTAPATEGNDILDYSKRSNTVTVNLSKTLTAANFATDTPVSGEASGDGAHISDKMALIKLGTGDDVIVIPSTSTVVHSVTGGPGNDSFTGGGAPDTFDGEAGDDTCIGNNATMNYSSRSAGITVTLCGNNCTSSDANDGDASATGSTHAGTGAQTATANGVTLATLTAGTGFTYASIGNQITFSNCTTATNEVAFPIVAFIDATSVKIDTSAVGAYVADTCDYSENRGTGVTANTGTAATLGAPTPSGGSVTGLKNTANMLGHKLTLLHSDATTGGAVTDDGDYTIVKVLTSSSVAVDTSGVGTFVGAVDALIWTETGAEKDNVQCASVNGGGGGDTITGDGRANTIKGGAGADTIMGGAGSDQIFGEAGADNLYGGGGDDTLIGGGGTGTDGIDNLFGGDGNDVLEGDTAADAFTCDGKNNATATMIGSNPGEADITVDFLSGTDTGGADCEF